MTVKLGSRAASAFAAAALALSGGALLVTGATPAIAASSTPLVGTFVLTTGSCAHGAASGSYLQMILPSGNASGPYMSNSDSSCANQDYTALSGGTDGGLITGKYQPSPNPPFDSRGNALAKRITAPAQYEGTAFATATEPVDPQTNTRVSVPTITDHGGRLTGDLRSFGVTWNNQYFNQGSPKPNGSYPGSSTPVSGTYDATTGAFTLTWISQVVGGPFDKFSCDWHLAGRFVPASASTTTTDSHTTRHSAGHHHKSAAVTGSSHTTTGTTTSGNIGKAGSVGTTTPPGSSSHASRPSATGNTVAPQVASTQAASTSTVSKDGWHASWWEIAVAIAIAVLGFGALAAINYRIKRAPMATS